MATTSRTTAASVGSRVTMLGSDMGASRPPA